MAEAVSITDQARAIEALGFSRETLLDYCQQSARLAVYKANGHVRIDPEESIGKAYVAIARTAPKVDLDGKVKKYLIGSAAYLIVKEEFKEKGLKYTTVKNGQKGQRGWIRREVSIRDTGSFGFRDPEPDDRWEKFLNTVPFLTDQELEVCGLFSRGMNRIAIARTMGLSNQRIGQISRDLRKKLEEPQFARDHYFGSLKFGGRRVTQTSKENVLAE